MTPEEIRRGIQLSGSTQAAADSTDDDPSEAADPGDIAVDLINACSMLEDIGKFFDFLLESGQHRLTRKTLREIERYSEGIYELLQDIEDPSEKTFSVWDGVDMVDGV